MKPQPNNQLSLYGPRGQRLYLDEAERGRFLAALSKATPAIEMLGLTLFYTGCRLSEAVALTPENIRTIECTIAIRTLKRRKMVMREVPVPAEFIRRFVGMNVGAGRRLWPWHRATAWRAIKALMQQADIKGAQASPKGLRHAFGVHAIRSGIQLNLLQKWMGHAQMSTTAIYADVTGVDEWRIAERMW